MDDFNTDWNYDRGPLGSLGGFTICAGFNTALPIGKLPAAAARLKWGTAWKAGVSEAKSYQAAMNINSASGSVMANRYNCFDLDPTYKNAFGQPLMRMTFRLQGRTNSGWARSPRRPSTIIAQAMNPASFNPATPRERLDGGAVSKHAQHRRHHHGRQSQSQRVEQVFAKLGLPQSVCGRAPNVFPHNGS